MPYYRMFGDVSREIDVWTNYAGKDNIVVTNITSAERATLGAPGEVETYALCDGVEPLAWNPVTSAWENFYTVLGIPVSAGAAGTNGTNGTDGINGNDGKSAYQLALDGGFVGTQSAWVASLNGTNGTAGTNGTNGTNGIGIAPSTPVAMTVAIGTAYQAPDPTKAAHINLMMESNYTTTIAGTSADELEVRIGPTNAVTGASGGTQAATWKTSLTGIALTVGLGIIQRNSTPIMLPVGWYFCVRRLAGTAAVISSAIAQPLG